MCVLVHIKNVHGSDTRKADTSVHGVHLLLCISKRWHRSHTNRYMVSHTLSLTHFFCALFRALFLSRSRVLSCALFHVSSLSRLRVCALAYHTQQDVA